MVEFSFTQEGTLPAYVRKCRDQGERSTAVYIPPAGLNVGVDGIPYTHTTCTWWVTWPKDGAGRVVVVVAVRDSATDSLRWFYGAAGGYGYDKLTAAAGLEGTDVVFTTCDGQRWTLRNHCGSHPSALAFSIRDMNRQPFPNGGRWWTP